MRACFSAFATIVSGDVRVGEIIGNSLWLDLGAKAPTSTDGLLLGGEEDKEWTGTYTD